MFLTNIENYDIIYVWFGREVSKLNKLKGDGKMNFEFLDEITAKWNRKGKVVTPKPVSKVRVNFSSGENEGINDYLSWREKEREEKGYNYGSLD